MAYLDNEQLLVANLTVSPSLPMNYYVVNVTILDDDVHEEDESVELAFLLYDEYEPSSGYRLIANLVVTVLIVEDDDPPRKYSNEEIHSRYYTTT